MASTAAGAVAGGASGAAAGLNEVANNYLLHEEQQEKWDKENACKGGERAACERIEELEALSRQRQNEGADPAIVLAASVQENQAKALNYEQERQKLNEQIAELARQYKDAQEPGELTAISSQLRQARNNLAQLSTLQRTVLATL